MMRCEQEDRGIKDSLARETNEGLSEKKRGGWEEAEEWAQEGLEAHAPGPVVGGQSVSFRRRKDGVTGVKKMGNGEEFGEI